MKESYRWIFLFGTLPSFASFGCGGDTKDGSNSDPPADGAGGSGGSAGGASGGNAGSSGSAGSGGGPTAPPAQGSLVFIVGQPSSPGAGCAISSAASAFIGGPPSSATGDPGMREVDGVAGAEIACRVSGNGTFEVSASVVKGVTSFTLVSGTVTSGGTGTGRISVSSPATAGKILSSPVDMPCELFVNRVPLQVAAGNIWAEFNCPLTSNASQPGSQCGVHGEFVLENCEL